MFQSLSGEGNKPLWSHYVCDLSWWFFVDSMWCLLLIGWPCLYSYRTCREKNIKNPLKDMPQCKNNGVIEVTYLKRYLLQIPDLIRSRSQSLTYALIKLNKLITMTLSYPYLICGNILRKAYCHHEAKEASAALVLAKCVIWSGCTCLIQVALRAFQNLMRSL